MVREGSQQLANANGTGVVQREGDRSETGREKERRVYRVGRSGLRWSREDLVLEEVSCNCAGEEYRAEAGLSLIQFQFHGSFPAHAPCFVSVSQLDTFHDVQQNQVDRMKAGGSRGETAGLSHRPCRSGQIRAGVGPRIPRNGNQGKKGKTRRKEKLGDCQRLRIDKACNGEGEGEEERERESLLMLFIPVTPAVELHYTTLYITRFIAIITLQKPQRQHI